MASEGISTLVDELEKHLISVFQNPSLPLDERLLEDCEKTLPERISKDDSDGLIAMFAQLLPTLQQDPTVATKVLVRLLQPYPLSAVLSFQPAVDFVGGLSTYNVPFNHLMLSILEKAGKSAADTATLAGLPAVILALVKLWLLTPDTGVAERAGKLMTRLIEIDQDFPFAGAQVPGSPCAGNGQGLMWRRIFADRNIYGAIFDACGRTSNYSMNQKSMAQTRLMHWLPAVAGIDWQMVYCSRHPDIERANGCQEDQGLLHFAAVHMVDLDDVLMHVNLIYFFCALLKLFPPAPDYTGSQISPALHFLATEHLHDRTVAYYLDADKPGHDHMDMKFLHNPAAVYVSTYARDCPMDFLRSSSKSAVLSRLSRVFGVPTTVWNMHKVNENDLSVLAALPRLCLLPQTLGRDAFRSSPLALVNFTASNPNALYALARIFRGPESAGDLKESAAARALYIHYANRSQDFFKMLVLHAKTIALKETALAAISLISAILNANWSPLPEDPQEVGGAILPNESMLHDSLPVVHLPSPATPLKVFLLPPAKEHLVPYLLSPAQTFTNLVGGRGSAENAAYEVAVAKFEVLREFHSKLSELKPHEKDITTTEILAAAGRRLTEGAWGVGGDTGGRIATMEM